MVVAALVARGPRRRGLSGLARARQGSLLLAAGRILSPATVVQCRVWRGRLLGGWGLTGKAPPVQCDGVRRHKAFFRVSLRRRYSSTLPPAQLPGSREGRAV